MKNQNIRGLPLLVSCTLTMFLGILKSVQGQCFTQSKFPKITDGIAGEALSYSIVGSEALNAVYQGGMLENPDVGNQGYQPFITKVSTMNNMVQWRRLYDVSNESKMKMVSAMALSPDNSKLAVVGTSYTDNFSEKVWIWTVSAADGRVLTDAMEKGLGEKNYAEHVVWDSGLAFSDSGKLLMSFMTTSPNLRPRNIYTSYSGKMLVGSFNFATSEFDWLKEHSSWGYSASLVYKNYGPGQPNIFIGGAHEENGNDSDSKSWQAAITRLNEDGSSPADADTLIKLGQFSNELDFPYIDQMHLDSTRPAEILFGSTRSIKRDDTAKTRLFLWSVELDSNHSPLQNSQRVFEFMSLQAVGNAVVIGIKPTLEGAQQTMHLMWQDNRNKVFYMAFNWSMFETSVLLYENVEQPSRAIFVGSETSLDQSVLIGQGYIAATMQTIKAVGFDASRSSKSAVILPTQRKMDSCLEEKNESLSVMFYNQVSSTTTMSVQSWIPNSLLGQRGEKQKDLLSWDLPISTQQSDEWCSPPNQTISSVQAGSVDGGFCISYDGIVHTLDFNPNQAISTGTCADVGPTWIYEIDTSEIDRKFIDVTIDSMTNKISMRAKTTGEEKIIKRLTVNGWLPSGETASWYVDIHVTSANCLSTGLQPPAVTNASYQIGDGLQFREVSPFITDLGCELAIYSYDVSENDWISGFHGNTGEGRLVSWSSDDYTKAGEYLITTYATNICTSAEVTYTLTVTYVPTILTSEIPDLKYYVSTEQKDITFPEFSSQPAGLSITYSYQISDVAAEEVIVGFDEDTRTISFFYDADLIPSGGPLVPSMDYQVTVTGTSIYEGSTLTGESTFKLQVSNPCVDSTFSDAITPVPDPVGPLDYRLQTGSLANPEEMFRHDEWDSLDFCGPIVLRATFDGFEINELTLPTVGISYIEASRTFEMYSEDYSQVGQRTVEITAQFASYPEGPSRTQQFVVNMIDPCEYPEEVTGKDPREPDEYFYSGSAPALEVQFDPIEFTPEFCSITYSCNVVSGPRTDLCALADGGSVGTFDPTTLSYKLETIEPADIPAGDYQFEITGTVGAVTHVMTFTATLVNPCYDIDFDFLPQPIPDFRYTLRDPLIQKLYSAETIIQVNTQANCGPVTISFVNDDATLSPVASSLFTVDENYFIVRQTADDQFAKVYSITEKVEWPDYSFVAVHPQPFEVQITDPCDYPKTLIASQTFPDLEYTLTGKAFMKKWDPFTIDPDICKVSYTMTIDSGGDDGALAMQFYPIGRAITISRNNELHISGTSLRDYTIRVTGTVGNIEKISDEFSFKLRLRNPCIDPEYVTLESVPLPTGLKYSTYTYEPNNGFKFTHDPFIVTTLPFTHTLCGEVGYQAIFDGQEINADSAALRYDEATRTFEIYSEDSSLKGFKLIRVNGFFKEYPQVVSQAETMIEITTMCDSPLSIAAPENTSDAVYTYSSEGISLKTESFTVDPSLCKVTYECISVSGPDGNLGCLDSSESSFDGESGTWTFRTDDKTKYKPGVYTLNLKGKVGDVSEISATTQLTFTLEDPCLTTDLKLPTNNAFSDINYQLGTPEVTFDFNANDLASYNTNFNCGPIEIEFFGKDKQAINSKAFATSMDLNSGTGQFSVISQADQSTQGGYEIGYRASLVDYPGVFVDSSASFNVFIFEMDTEIDNETGFVNTDDTPQEIVIPEAPTFSEEEVTPYEVVEKPDSDFVPQKRPKWLNKLEDQRITVGDSLVYEIGDEQEDEKFEEVRIEIDFGKAGDFVKYNSTLKQFSVDNDSYGEDQIGRWNITVWVSVEGQVFSKSFYIDIVPQINEEADIREEIESNQEEDKTETVDSSNFYETYSKLRAVYKPQTGNLNRPNPYIASFSQTGVMTIAWDRPMQPYGEPKKIPETQIAINSQIVLEKLDMFEDEISSQQRRSLKALGDPIKVASWFDQMREGERMRMMILDALQVSVMRQTDDDDELLFIHDFEWDILGFDKDYIQLDIDFKHPEEIGNYSSQDFVTVTFWGVEFFKSYQGVEVEIGTQLKHKLNVQMSKTEYKNLEAAEEAMTGLIAIGAGSILLFIGVGGRLLPTWMFLNTLSLISHTPLLKNYMPAGLYHFLVYYLGFFRLDSYSRQEAMEKEPQIVSGSIIYMIGALFAMLTLTIFLFCWDSSMKKCRGKRPFYAAWMANATLRLVYEFFLEFCLVILIQLASPNGFYRVPALFGVLAVAILLCFLLTRFYWGGPYIKKCYEPNSLGQSFWGVRSLRAVSSPPEFTKQVDKMTPKATPKSVTSVGSYQTAASLELCFGTSAPSTPQYGISMLTIPSPKQNLCAKPVVCDDKKLTQKVRSEIRVKSQQSEAERRVILKEQVRVNPAYQTLFYGLKKNDPHNVAIVHPLTFLLRRIVYALAIVFMTRDMALSSSLLLLFSTLFMLGYAACEVQWEDSLINMQHIGNEVVTYFFCVTLVCFAGVVSDITQVTMLGNIVLTALFALIIFNVCIILYDLANFIYQMLARYKAIARRMKSKVAAKKKVNLVVPRTLSFNKIQVDTEVGLVETEHDRFETNHENQAIQINIHSVESEDDDETSKVFAPKVTSPLSKQQLTPAAGKQTSPFSTHVVSPKPKEDLLLTEQQLQAQQNLILIQDSRKEPVQMQEEDKEPEQPLPEQEQSHEKQNGFRTEKRAGNRHTPINLSDLQSSSIKSYFKASALASSEIFKQTPHQQYTDLNLTPLLDEITEMQKENNDDAEKSTLGLNKEKSLTPIKFDTKIPAAANVQTNNDSQAPTLNSDLNVETSGDHDQGLSQNSHVVIIPTEDSQKDLDQSCITREVVTTESYDPEKSLDARVLAMQDSPELRLSFNPNALETQNSPDLNDSTKAKVLVLKESIQDLTQNTQANNAMPTRNSRLDFNQSVNQSEFQTRNDNSFMRSIVLSSNSFNRKMTASALGEQSSLPILIERPALMERPGLTNQTRSTAKQVIHGNKDRIYEAYLQNQTSKDLKKVASGLTAESQQKVMSITPLRPKLGEEKENLAQQKALKWAGKNKNSDLMSGMKVHRNNTFADRNTSVVVLKNRLDQFRTNSVMEGITRTAQRQKEKPEIAESRLLDSRCSSDLNLVMLQRQRNNSTSQVSLGGGSRNVKQIFSTNSLARATSVFNSALAQQDSRVPEARQRSRMPLFERFNPSQRSVQGRQRETSRISAESGLTSLGAATIIGGTNLKKINSRKDQV